MLAIPRVERQAEWKIQEHPRAASFGEDLPHFPSATGLAASAYAGSPPSDESGGGPVHRPTPSVLIGGMGMERQASASGTVGGTVGGIDWVDWYDCYKRYKAQKIRAEAEVTRAKDAIPEDSPVDHASTINEGSPTATITDNPSTTGGGMAEPGVYDAESAIALTPTTSRDEYQESAEYRKRSPSIRSSFSASDFKLRKASIFDRPRQTSGSSARSSDMGHTAAVKRKKNLVTKMEGWWNAVKSNFTPETQHPPPYNSSTRGSGHDRRIPSEPNSRRGSEFSPASDNVPTLLAPQSIAGPSKPPLRTTASHADFRSRSNTPEPPLTASTSAQVAGQAAKTQASAETKMSTPLPTARLEQEPASRSSLDSRRRQPNLRLDLESNVLSKPTGRIPGALVQRNSNEKTSSQPSQRPSETTSRSSSYGPLYGPGLTPGVSLWQQTPSPIVALETSPGSDHLSNRPVAPGAELTVASVRHHVKRRLNAAKEVCDAKLRETIASITRYAEDQRTQLDRPFEDSEDYFEAISDSPLVDADDSDLELGDAFDGLGPRRKLGQGG